MRRENGLENKRVVVLGGSSGIGFAVAELAAAQGAKTIIASSNAERVQKAIESLGGDVQGHVVDVSDERAVETFFAKLGPFDHLAYSAGDSLYLHELATTDLMQARRAFELRYWSALAAVKYGSPHIRKGGSVVLTTGVAGRPAQGMGNCRQCLRNHRSLDPRPGGRIGADSCQLSVTWSRSDQPLAEHECSRTGAPV